MWWELVVYESSLIWVIYGKPSPSYCAMWYLWWGCARTLTLITTGFGIAGEISCVFKTLDNGSWTCETAYLILSAAFLVSMPFTPKLEKYVLLTSYWGTYKWYNENWWYNHFPSESDMKSEVLPTVWCYIPGEAAGEIWCWSLLGLKGLRLAELRDWVCSRGSCNTILFPFTKWCIIDNYNKCSWCCKLCSDPGHICRGRALVHNFQSLKNLSTTNGDLPGEKGIRKKR